MFSETCYSEVRKNNTFPEKVLHHKERENVFLSSFVGPGGFNKQSKVSLLVFLRAFSYDHSKESSARKLEICEQIESQTVR